MVSEVCVVLFYGCLLFDCAPSWNNKFCENWTEIWETDEIVKTLHKFILHGNSNNRFNWHFLRNLWKLTNCKRKNLNTFNTFVYIYNFFHLQFYIIVEFLVFPWVLHKLQQNIKNTQKKSFTHELEILRKALWQTEQNKK